MIEKNFDIAFVADMALREKQIQQNYRPVIAVHKWFARRPGTLFRGLLLSEFQNDIPLRDSFYQSNNFSGCHIADPFMGGGTPVLEANRTGCDITGFDINPMAYWVVKQEIEHLDLAAYTEAAADLRASLEAEIGHFYRTRCLLCGSEAADVKYFLWIKYINCKTCGNQIDLFQKYLISTDARHPKNVFVCPVCGDLTETDSRKTPGPCRHCQADLLYDGPAKRGHCTCHHCGTDNRFPAPENGPPDHRIFAMEYYCRACKPSHTGRFFKKPDLEDLEKINEAETRWKTIESRFVPNDSIPSGDETNRLHRWGYRYYREMFNPRQLLGLELSAQLIALVPDERVRNALATNLSDLLRYQNMLCRYDTKTLKSLDIFSIHGFPVGLIQCESNFSGIMEPGRTLCVGSGGWANIIEKYKKAKAYCDHPFEVQVVGGRKKIIPIEKEWIGDRFNGTGCDEIRRVDISCRDAATADLPDNSLDAVFTDPPYFGNVQYAELMDFCYVWLKRLVGHTSAAFNAPSTRNAEELTGNVDMGRDFTHFTTGLSMVFQRMAGALKKGSPLVFTYHHNKLDAYYPLAVAILDAGLVCSASLPCPGEMGGSIHINGTGSSIIDTVFVCRSTGVMQRKWLADSPKEVAKIIQADLAYLKAGNVKPTPGDIRCIIFGHLVRLAIWSLRPQWEKNKPITSRIAKVAAWLLQFGRLVEIEQFVKTGSDTTSDTTMDEMSLFAVNERIEKYGTEHDEIPF
jgi:putative DNA methylase